MLTYPGSPVPAFGQSDRAGGTMNPSHPFFEAYRGPQVLDVARKILLGGPPLGVVFGEVLHEVG